MSRKRKKHHELRRLENKYGIESEKRREEKRIEREKPSFTIKIHKEKIFLGLIIILGVYYCFLATTSPMTGEDEAVYIAIGEMISQGNLIGAAPFFIPTLYAPFFLLLGPSLAIAKVISAVFGLLTLIAVYFVGRRVSVEAGIFSALLLLTMQWFTHFMLIAYMEVPIAFFSVVVLYLMFRMDSWRWGVVMGVVLGVSFYTKFSGLFLVMFFTVYALHMLIIERNRAYFKYSLIALLVFSAMFVPYVARNLILYDYPYVTGLDMLFETPVNVFRLNTLQILSLEPGTHPYYEIAGATMRASVDFENTFGWAALLFVFMGSAYAWVKKEKLMLLPIAMVVLFFGVWIVNGGEARYFSIIFPQMALVGGMFLGSVTKHINKKWVSGILVLVVTYLALTISLPIAEKTSTLVRFPADYIEALDWIEKNTPYDSFIFTAFGGSVRYYGRRDQIWNQIPEYPYMMETNSSEYIHTTLSDYNVSHILVWAGIVGEEYFIPGRNMAGIFNTNFVNLVFNDPDNFKTVFKNTNNIVIEVI